MNTAKIPSPFSVRLRRSLAWTIDWNILGGIALILTAIAWEVAAATGQTLFHLLIIPLMIAWFVLFILRDVVFGKVSLGKRIMKLRVIDKLTGNDAAKKQKAMRGLSAFFIGFDALFMLISGHSLGDRLADTAVVKDSFELSGDGTLPQNGYYVTETGEIIPQKTSAKTVVAVIVSVIAIIAAFAIIMATVISTVFRRVKKSEEYKLAYDYLITSMYFEYYDLEEEDVSLTSYSAATDGRTNTRNAAFTFNIDGKQVTVYCIREDGNWYVSEDASKLNTPNK